MGAWAGWAMGVCRSRAVAAPAEPWEDAVPWGFEPEADRRPLPWEDAVPWGLEPEADRRPFDAWARLVRRARRLGRLRRLWALVGHHLQEVKRRGRAIQQ